MEDIFAGGGGGRRDRSTIRAKLGFQWFPDSEVDDQVADFGTYKSSLSLTLTPYRSEANNISISFGAVNQRYDTQAVFPETGSRHPSSLWKLRIGIGGAHTFDNKWTLSLNLTATSASDKPFFSIYEIGIRTMGSLRIPMGKKDALMAGFFFGSSQNELNSIPIPSLAYFWHVHERLQIIAGLPFLAIMTRPVDALWFMVMYFPITKLRASLTFFPVPFRMPKQPAKPRGKGGGKPPRPKFSMLSALSFTCSFGVESDAFWIAGRDDKDMQIGHYRAKVDLGCSLRMPFGSFKASVGYAFYRFAFEKHNKSLIDLSPSNRIDIAPGGFLAVELGFHF